jgi:succinate--hydroxymethylglutarate CoA-transferase
VTFVLFQFKVFAEKVLEKPELANDPKFSTNDARVANRTELVEIINEALMQHEREHWLERLTGLGWVEAAMNFPRC